MSVFRLPREHIYRG